MGLDSFQKYSIGFKGLGFRIVGLDSLQSIARVKGFRV